VGPDCQPVKEGEEKKEEKKGDGPPLAQFAGPWEKEGREEKEEKEEEEPARSSFEPVNPFNLSFFFFVETGADTWVPPVSET